MCDVAHDMLSTHMTNAVETGKESGELLVCKQQSQSEPKTVNGSNEITYSTSKLWIFNKQVYVEEGSRTFSGKYESSTGAYTASMSLQQSYKRLFHLGSAAGA